MWNAAQCDTALDEDENPPKNDTIAGFKVANLSSGREQLQFTQTSEEVSPVRRSVELVVCTHGERLNGEDVTLMIYRLHLSGTKQPQYHSAMLRFTFKAHNPSQAMEPAEVLAWTPFSTQE